MIGGINNNTESSLVQRYLQQNQQAKKTILERLSSGRKINRGSDDPAGIIAVSDLKRAITAAQAESDAMRRAQSNANISEAHFSEMTNLQSELGRLNIAKANASSPEEQQAYQMQIDNTVASINRFANDARQSIDSFNMPDDGNAELDTQISQIVSDANAFQTATQSGDFAAAETALDSMSTQTLTARGNIGAYHNDLGARIRATDAQRVALEESRSRIEDTDFAEATAELARRDVLDQAGHKLLGITNQNASNVLQLLS